jgi:uncharacterized protein with NRDE domain
MCLIAVAWRMHPRYRLVLAANRDEFHERPSLPLAAWDDDARILGGRDALHGGSWLALRGARLAAVTNVRRLPQLDGRSRGELVAEFLRAEGDLDAALATLAAQAAGFRAFNLLLGDGASLALATNLPDPHPGTDAAPAASDPRGFAVRRLAPGIHGLSNGALHARWPKAEALQAALADWLDGAAHAGHADIDDAAGDSARDALFDALADRRIAEDARLPDTGVGLERERWLSSAFIAHPVYGTRASSVALIADDHALLIERRFGPDGVFIGETRLRTAAA